ncbi:MAG: septum formation inhibitor Maf [Pseudomonadales bacterium]|nr:septum formation inhibitor Maf [Pseudomonadales bacterium]
MPAGASDTPQAIILASASPRRAELLTQIGLLFEVRLPAPPVDETPHAGESAETYVERLARAKARAVAITSPGRVVLAADTTVVLDGAILGKPGDVAEAVTMLLALAGRTHAVCTGVAVAHDGRVESLVARTRVRFRPVDRAEAEAYARTGEGADKAGGYGIQGIGAIFAEAIEGSYSTVVGLPLAETERLLRAAGVDTWALRNGRP